MKGKRIKRWIPNVSLTDITISTPFMLLLSILLMTGKSFVFGVEGGEIHTVPIPKVPIAGWVLVYLALSQFLPPVIQRRIDSASKLLRAKVIGLFKRDKTDIKSRIEALGG